LFDILQLLNVKHKFFVLSHYTIQNYNFKAFSILKEVKLWNAYRRSLNNIVIVLMNLVRGRKGVVNVFTTIGEMVSYQLVFLQKNMRRLMIVR